MPKVKTKIYQTTAFTLLAIIISSLLNVCLFTLQAKAAPLTQPKLDFAYSGGENCSAESMPTPVQTVNRPAAPMPECCLTQNRNFDAIVNVANDKSAPTSISQAILPLDNYAFENYSTQYNLRLTYPPPEALALAATVIRE